MEAFAPGRVNLIGDHTDHTGGFALPMAIQLGTTVRGSRGGGSVDLVSADEPEALHLELADPLGGAPEGSWGRYVAGVVAQLRPPVGFRGRVGTTLPLGGGLSSSAALEVATALALGFSGTTLELAELCQRAEQSATGVPCGIMDQLASAGGVAGHALLLDAAARTLEPVPLPERATIVVVDSGEPRRLAGSAYANRRAACEEAQRQIGSLRGADPARAEALEDPVLGRRARHVITENRRVLACAEALAGDRLAEAGRLMVESHRSLRDDLEVSTPGLDRLVEELCSRPGVYGARLTGAGFGGCVVALTAPGTLEVGRTVEASAGARVR